MKDKIKLMSFNIVTVKDFEKIGNTGFARGRVRIAYAGKNRNYSNIFLEAFEKAMDSLQLVPVVGHWIKNDSDLGGRFGGHDIKLETDGNDIDLAYKTVPYGVVPETNNYEWVDLEDENGNVKRYLECDVVLWEDRYPKQVQAVREGKTAHSMEIEVLDGEWDENYDYFNIYDFRYDALCLLGTNNENPNLDVEPCFEDSAVFIPQYSFSQEDFKQQFNLMMEELKAVHLDPEGGEDEVDKFNFDINKEEVKTMNQIDLDEQNNSKQEPDEGQLKGESVTCDCNPVESDEYKELSTRFDSLLEESEEDKAMIDSLNEQIKVMSYELSSYKTYYDETEKAITEAQKDELFIDFDDVLNESQEYAEIKENRQNYTVEELKSKLSLLFTEYNLNKKKSKKKSSQTKVVLEREGFDLKESPYGDLFIGKK